MGSTTRGHDAGPCANQLSKRASVEPCLVNAARVRQTGVMPRPIWSGTISFGLVAIPIKLYNGVSKKNVAFNQLDDRSMSRIKL